MCAHRCAGNGVVDVDCPPSGCHFGLRMKGEGAGRVDETIGGMSWRARAAKRATHSDDMGGYVACRVREAVSAAQTVVVTGE